MAIFKECMRCVNTPFHSQILHLFQFAGEMSNSHIYTTFHIKLQPGRNQDAKVYSQRLAIVCTKVLILQSLQRLTLTTRLKCMYKDIYTTMHTKPETDRKPDVSGWLLFNLKWAFFFSAIYMTRTSLSYIFIRWWWWNPLSSRPTCLLDDFYGASSLKQKSIVDMSLHSDTFFWFRANQSLLFLLSALCLAEKQQISILKSLV